MGDRKAAIASFRRAYVLEPQTARGQLQLAKALIEEGAISEARDRLLGVIRLEPNLAAAHGLLGNVYQQLGLFGDAVASLETAIGIQPRVARPYFDLVYCR